MAGSDTAGFWSYVHADDVGGEGQIMRLAAGVRAEYGLLTGEELNLFVDHDSLEWGEQWEERIARALEGATFFIPIVTPRYFMSSSCREELLKFRAAAARLGLEELLLPVYWIGVREIDAGSPSDEAMALVASRQWEDLREVRLLDESSSAYRGAVSRLARKLVDIAEKITELASASSAVPSRAGTELTVEEDETPGVVEILAEGEQAMTSIVEITEAMTPVMVRFGELAEEATGRLHAADSRGAGFAGRLRETQRFATELAEPAGEIERLGQRYAAELVKLDPAVLTLIEVAANATAEEREDAQEFFDNMRSLTEAAAGAIVHLESFVSELDGMTTLSRGLRKPLRQMKSGLRGFIDGRALMDEWDRRIAEASGDDETGDEPQGS